MRKHQHLILFISILMLMAFVTVAIAAPAMVSAKQTFTKAGAKVVFKAKVMTITKGKTVIVINAKGITKNKVAVKNAKGKYKLAKNDYLINAALAKTLLPPAAKPAATSVKPAAPATPAAPEPQAAPAKPAVDVPAGLEGAKADAYILLAGCKYDGAGKGNLTGFLKDLPMGMGDLKFSMDITCKASGCSMSTDGIPLLAGGNLDNKAIPAVPFKELITGDKDDIVKFLKSADKVTAADGVITIGKANPPDSMVTVLNNIAKLQTTGADQDLTCKITVQGNKVVSIDAINMNGKFSGPTGKYASNVSGSLTY